MSEEVRLPNQAVIQLLRMLSGVALEKMVRMVDGRSALLNLCRTLPLLGCWVRFSAT